MDLQISAHDAAVLLVRLSRQRLSPVAEAAAKHEPKVRSVFLRSVKATRDAVPMRALEEVLSLGHSGTGAPLYVVEPALQAVTEELIGEPSDDALSTIAHHTFVRSLKRKEKKLPSVLLDAMEAGAKASRVSFTIVFDATNAEAVAWAEENAALLVVGITTEARAAIRTIVSESFDAGMAPRETAKLIRASIGLTERDAGAVMRQQLKDLASGMSDAKATARAEKYAGKLLRSRAQTIARTESMRAANEGQQQLWNQARAKGLLPATAQKTWIAYDPCPICLPLSGEIVPVDGVFSNGLEGPPAHPNCRCVTGIV